MDFNETLSILKEDESKAYEEGYEVGFTKGGKRSDCPSNYTQREKSEWKDGFKDGQYDRTTSYGRGMSEVLSPKEILAQKAKSAVFNAMKKNNKLKPGEDIMPDPEDKSGKKWKVIPAKINQQAKNAIITRG